MGKKQKIRSGAGDVVTLPGPLDKQIEKEKLAKNKPKFQKHLENLEDNEKIEELTELVDDGNLLKLARKQRDQEETTEQNFFFPNLKSASRAFHLRGSDSEDNDEENEEEVDIMRKQVDEELQKISEEDAAAMNKFLKTSEPSMTKTLHDLIQDKILEKKVSFKETFGGDDMQIHDLDPDVVALFKDIGKQMHTYKSGKIPKAFKFIPSFANWEQILDLTDPDGWSSATMLQATRLFSACMNPAMCQRFYNLVLLPRIRDHIDEYKIVKSHMRECLFKAMYKPAPFFKGILLPLLESGTCTIREALIFGSVLRKISIPMLHAAAAMLKISEMEYCGASSIILRVLIQKRYTLPFRVIDGLVFSFLKMRFARDQTLPVLWHQCLLAFVEEYKADISSEQREALLDLLKTRCHHQITPEIRHHLQTAESRNEESEANVPDYARADFDDSMEF